MELDDIIDKDIYIIKQQEIKIQIAYIHNKKNELLNLKTKTARFSSVLIYNL